MNKTNSNLLVFIILLLLPTAGCKLLKRAEWKPAEVTSPRVEISTQRLTLAMAESAYARAIELESNCNAACVDYFFQAATLAWSDVEQQACQCVPRDRATEVYHSALTKLITAGQEFRRFDPRRGLDIKTAEGRITIPTCYHGFTWQPEDFDHLIPVGDYSTKDINNAYRYCGQGVATVALHCNRSNEPFRKSPQPFCATVLLRPVSGDNAPLASSFVLELFDPLRIESTDICGRQVPLQRDISAQFVYSLSQVDRQFIKSFTHPGSTTENSGLLMIEPYQPGKIPLVFVHGLLSDPYTWINMANELRSHPEIRERYQLWGFQYATGEPFLKSAAILRRQLQEMQMRFDPTGSDAALSKMVLVGHSMGGLVSKLQITHSGSQLWDALSCRPLERIITTPRTRMALAESVFFEPSPLVSRVVFIGTPHRGSPWAYRSIGRFGSKLVDEPSSMDEQHKQLLRDNPDVFSREFTKRVPTSIDLLKPHSPLLLATDKLTRDGSVKINTIAGNGYHMLGAGDSDTIVPLSSAVVSGAETEKFIHAKHSDLNKVEQSIHEILCILKKHLQESDQVPQK